jgi:N-acetyl-alpha-D-muramate 1-phosphate uridylyltransferase
MTKKMFPMVILAGGLATRLRPLTETIPKAMLETNGKPFVEHQLRLLAKNGITEVLMCLGYLGEQIIEFVGDGSRFNVKVEYVFDGPTLLGTAGAIKRALPFIAGDTFFVLNGDSYLPCDYAAVQGTFVASGRQALMTVFHNEGKWDTSNVEFGDNRIIAYDKVNRTPRMLYIDYGLEVFTKDAFATVPDNEPYDLVPVYQALLKKQQLAAHEVKQRFYENGSFAGISELATYLADTELAS